MDTPTLPASQHRSLSRYATRRRTKSAEKDAENAKPKGLGLQSGGLHLATLGAVNASRISAMEIANRFPTRRRAARSDRAASSGYRRNIGVTQVLPQSVAVDPAL